MLHISENGLRLIKNFEGFRATTYCCPSGQPTIGYGHSGPGATAGRRVTVAEAEAMLRKDVVRFEAVVRLGDHHDKLNQNQFDALVSFAYNVGTGSFSKSSVFIALNTGELSHIPPVLKKYTRGGSGIPLLGLVKRRAAEIALFNSPVKG